MLQANQLPLWLVVLILGALALSLITWFLVGWNWLRGEPALERRGRRRAPWGADGAALAVLFLMGALISVAAGPSASDSARESGLELSNVFLQGMVFFAFTGVTVGWLASNNAPRPAAPSDFGLGGPVSRWPRDLLLGVLGTAAMLPIVYSVNGIMIALFGEPTVHPAIESLMETPETEAVAAAGLLAVVLAPLFEELAFRVLLQGWLEKLTPRSSWLPILISATLFGLAHTNQGFAPIPIVVLALGLGYVYRQTHSYPAVVAMHAAFNALSLAVAIGAGQLQTP